MDRIRTAREDDLDKNCTLQSWNYHMTMIDDEKRVQLTIYNLFSTLLFWNVI